jgi:hypothetical protein
MKLAVLILIFIPLAVAAQERDSGALAKQSNLSFTSPSGPSSINGQVLLAEPEPGADTESGFGASAQQPQGVQTSQSTKSSLESQPIIPLQHVGGYVDSAIIRSEVRIFFDDAFHDTAPDRAEFFYAQCACTNLMPRAPGPDLPGANNNINFQQVYVGAEYAPVSRFSAFVEIPFRWIEPQPSGIIPGSFTPPQMGGTQTNSGISDVRAGAKFALAASSTHALTLQIRAYFPSGNASLGLGTAHFSVEPSLLYYQRLSQRWTLESQFGDWHPIGGSSGTLLNSTTQLSSTTPTNFAGDILTYGIGPSYRLIDGERFKFVPVLEVFGWHVIDGLQTPAASFLPPGPNIAVNTCNDPGTPAATTPGCAFPASDINIVNIKVGARTFIGPHNSFYVGFGQAVTHDVWYKNIVRLEYRYSF